MLQEKIAVRHNVVALPPFAVQNVAASQTDVQLPVAGATDQDGVLALCGGYVIGMAVQLNAAASAGSLTVGVTVDGTEATITTRTITTQQTAMARWKTDGGAPRFSAGQKLGVEITTNGTWNGTTADLMVTVYVVYEDWDF